MELGAKLRYLREVEGTLRGLGREMTQQEVVRSIKKEQGKTISQSYLSQIENGARPHLTNSTRMLLAKFFKVHPGFLVDDPEGYHTELTSDLRTDDRWPALTAQLPAQVRAVAGIPLLLSGSPVGTLNVYYDQPAEWDDSDIQALRGYSALATGVRGKIP